MQDKKRGPRPFKKSLTEELVDLDRDLAYMLAKRTRLLGRAASSRQSKGLSLADPNQERRMRRAWDEVAARHGLDVKPLRQMFTLANGLAYSTAVKPESASRKFIMNPQIKGLDLVMSGPRSRMRTQLAVALAAAAGATCSLDSVVLGDSLIQLVKGLNQAGAALSWEGEAVLCKGGKLDMPGKTVHAGDDPLNLFLLLALALPQIGRTTFTGGTRLKLLDLSGAAHVLAGMGVRVTPIEPHLSGAPVRLESAGMTTGKCHLPEDFPEDLALAMALAGPTYPEGLTMTWDEGFDGVDILGHAVDMLDACGVKAELSDTEFTVAKAELAVPETMDRDTVYMDPELCATLLALPRLGAERVALSGAWPAGEPEAEVIEAMLKASGVRLDISKSGITATAGEWPEKVDLDATHGHFALATALGLAAPCDARIAVFDEEDTATAEDLAARMGGFARVKPGRVVLVGDGRRNKWDRPMQPWPSPASEWSLCLALISTTAQGVTLANPGSLSEVWPGFWGLFADNFKPKDKESEDDGRKKGRRIRIR